VRIPGRFEHVGRFIFDVAHNPAGSEVVAETLAAVQPARPVTAVLCILRDKDWRAMMATLAPAVDRFILTMAPTAPASRAWDLSEALAYARKSGFLAEAEPDFSAALARAQEGEGTILVTGSFHTVGDAMGLLH
jgi:dihydrofolate synthase/folylpolyglutamate synthase